MTVDQVNEALENYRAKKARLEHLRIESDELMRAIEAEAASAAEREAIRGQQYTGMPHSGGVNRGVEDAAIRYADGYAGGLAKAWREDWNEMQQEITQLMRAVRLVEAWLGALGEKELVVVTAHRLDGRSWNELSASSRRLLGEHMSVSGLRAIGRAAMAKIYDIAK